jgi:hypothetical protein
MLGDVLQLDPYAVLVLFENLGEGPAFMVQDSAGTGKLMFLELRVIRQICSRFVVEVDDGAEIDGGRSTFSFLQNCL